MNTLPSVRVGQVWADMDPRSPGRKIMVKEVVTVVNGIALANPYAVVASTTGRGRSTRVRLDRFRPVRSGYSLLHDVPGGAS